MSSATISTDCGYSHDDRECFCDLCGQEIAPPCASITISVGHMESPEGEGGFDVCLDCAGRRQGFTESIAMLAAEVTDKWEARMQPIREFRKARGDLQAEFAEGTSAQRRVFGARLAKLADEHERATGQEVPEFDRRIDWPF